MKELTEYKNSLSTQIALEEQQAKNRSRKLLVKIMRQKKVTDYSVCYRKNLYSIFVYNNRIQRCSLCN